MAGGRRKKASRKPATRAAPADVVVAEAVRQTRDIRPFVYLALDQLFVVIYFYVINYVIPTRLWSGAVHMWALPILMQAMAIGMALGFVRAPHVRRIGWWIAVVGASLLVLVTILLIVRVLVSAAFLSGVYGAFGKAAAISALIGVALVVELVALLPLFQIKYLRTRAGRRAFTMA